MCAQLTPMHQAFRSFAFVLAASVTAHAVAQTPPRVSPGNTQPIIRRSLVLAPPRAQLPKGVAASRANPTPSVPPPSVTPALPKPSVSSAKAQMVSRSIATLTAQTSVKAAQALSQRAGDAFLTVRTSPLRYQNSWAELFAAGRDSPALRQQLVSMASAARSYLADSPDLFQRPMNLGQVAPSQLDSRVRIAGRNAEVFALAMADSAQAHYVRTRGVSLAIAAAYMNDSDCLARSIEILRAMSSHTPLQRPGWTAYLPYQVLPPGGDGVWLATGWGISGIVDMLSILGDRVPSDLQAELNVLLRREVLQIVSDWADRRPWYVKGRMAQSNQWIEPSVGLARATLFLGDPGLASAYEVAAENLSVSLGLQGADGAFKEGFGYGMMSAGSLLDAVGEMRAAGDVRFGSTGFAANAWKWMLHNQMPGGRYVNSFDAGSGNLPDWAVRSPMPAMISAVRATSDQSAIEALQFMFPQPNPTIEGLRYAAARRASGSHGMPLPSYAHFPSQAQLMWRSKWEPAGARSTAFAIWVRGGTVSDSHCHRDQGQVSAYIGERCILMDCGTPDYATPQFEERFASAAGHGILQCGERKPRGAAVDAPIQVERLDDRGGHVRIDTTSAYVNPVISSVREVAWDGTAAIDIADDVKFASEIGSGTELYRLHTGCRSTLDLSEGDTGEWNASWPGVRIKLKGDRAIEVTQAMWPDAAYPGAVHVVLQIRSRHPTDGLRLTTQVRVDQATP